MPAKYQLEKTLHGKQHGMNDAMITTRDLGIYKI